MGLKKIRNVPLKKKNQKCNNGCNRKIDVWGLTFEKRVSGFLVM